MTGFLEEGAAKEEKGIASQAFPSCTALDAEGAEVRGRMGVGVHKAAHEAATGKQEGLTHHELDCDTKMMMIFLMLVVMDWAWSQYDDESARVSLRLLDLARLLHLEDGWAAVLGTSVMVVGEADSDLGSNKLVQRLQHAV